MEFLKAHQLNIMLYLSGICSILFIQILQIKSMSLKRKRILISLFFANMILLLSDRYAYLYRGVAGTLGFWMVRISNFLVFFGTLFIPLALALYLSDLFRNEYKMTVMPERLRLCRILFVTGTVLLIISQFTGLYYTFDEQNVYHRAPGYFISYVFPLLIMLLQISVEVQYYKSIRRTILYLLLLSSVILVAASVIQLFAYGLSLTNIASVGVSILLYMYVLHGLDKKAEHAKKLEIDFYREEQQREHELFVQTAKSLANAIDAKDKYTLGHSSRVATYSQQIAKLAGKSDEECEKVYFAGLLHDVGKIGIPDTIINKDGKLTDEEFEQIKKHPQYGNEILSSIQESPYLSIGAHYHHERYDGRGYPDHLKGDDIPEIARIISVADAYDAMTSKRSYRDPIPQDKVREELVKGMGTQFDPQFAKIMLHLLDLDTEYSMQERESGDGLFKTYLNCDRLLDDYTTGIPIIDRRMHIHLVSRSKSGFAREGMPTLVVFDSLDGRIQDTDAKKKDLLYLEYGRIRMDGQTLCGAARKMETRFLPSTSRTSTESDPGNATHSKQYDIEAVRIEDHLSVRISDGFRNIQIIIALPDSSRFSYIAITGEHCAIHNIQFKEEDVGIPPEYIPRIAEKISYINGCPEGDIPNVEVDRWRSASSESIPVSGSMKLVFHAMSLPTARLVWHCPFVMVFTSKDGKVNGESFRELALVRLDGENWESDDYVENVVTINPTGDFVGWNKWKEQFRKGVDCEVSLTRSDNQITVSSTNLGMHVKCVTTVRDKVDEIYVALTGDQCAITDIHIRRPDETHPADASPVA